MKIKIELDIPCKNPPKNMRELEKIIHANDFVHLDSAYVRFLQVKSPMVMGQAVKFESPLLEHLLNHNELFVSKKQVYEIAAQIAAQMMMKEEEDEYRDV